MFATDTSIAVPDLAVAAEERDLHSIYLPEHTHIPTSRLTPAPTGTAELAEEYRRTMDPLIALAAAAASTEKIRLGTGICLVAQREPIVTAKAIASLDQLSNGRFEFGVGFGWNREEMADHGVDYTTRREQAREHVLAMRTLWREEAAEFSGDFVNFSSSWSGPKPKQLGGPPVLIGGAPGPKLFSHIVEYGDGWMPIGGGGVKAALGELAQACAKANRDPAEIRIVPFGVIPDPGKVDYYESIGVGEIIFLVPTGSADAVLPVLDAHAQFIAQRDG